MTQVVHDPGQALMSMDELLGEMCSPGRAVNAEGTAGKHLTLWVKTHSYACSRAILCLCLALFGDDGPLHRLAPISEPKNMPDRWKAKC